MTKLEAMNTIIVLLDKYYEVADDEFCESGQGALLDEAFAVFGLHSVGVAWYDGDQKDYGAACDLAPAVEYFLNGRTNLPAFEDALKKADACVWGHKYRHYVDAETYEDVGYYVVAGMFDEDIPKIILDHTDFDAVGRDVAEQEQGKFTRYGYFAPTA